MKKLVLILSIYSFFFGQMSTAFAQTATSNYVITRVGDAPLDKKPQIGGDLIKAAQDLVNAYKNCDMTGDNPYNYHGVTTVTQQRSNCLKTQLSSLGYSGKNLETASNMNLFADRDGGVPNACAECTEFVVQSLILAYGGADQKAFKENCSYECVPFNGNWPVKYNWDEWSNNNHIYKRVNGHIPQIGDIASTDDDPDITGEATQFGHILIVKDIKKDSKTFTGYESNWGGIPWDGGITSHLQCYVSDTVDYHPFQYYTYWRLQQ